MREGVAMGSSGYTEAGSGCLSKASSAGPLPQLRPRGAGSLKALVGTAGVWWKDCASGHKNCAHVGVWLLHVCGQQLRCPPPGLPCTRAALEGM